MNAEAFDAPAVIEPADLPAGLQQFAYALPPVLDPGTPGANLVIAIEIEAYQRS